MQAGYCYCNLQAGYYNLQAGYLQAGYLQADYLQADYLQADYLQAGYYNLQAGYCNLQLASGLLLLLLCGRLPSGRV